MKIRKLMSYSRNSLKGRRIELLLICLLPIGAELFLRTAESALYSLMIYFGNIAPVDLFSGKNTEQAVISVLFALLRCLAMPMLWCGLAARLMVFAEKKRETLAFSDMLLSGKFILRAISASFFARLISAVILLPSLSAVAYAIYLLSDGAKGGELIFSANLIALGIIIFIYWAGIRLSLTAVPFLLWKFKNISALKVVFFTLRFMRKRRRFPLMLALTYLPPVMTIALAPYFIPEWAAAYAVGISIFLKEDETADEQSDIYSRNGNFTSAEKLSSGKLRSFGRSAPTAEKSRWYRRKRKLSTDS